MSEKPTQKDIQKWLLAKINGGLQQQLEDADLEVPFLELGLTSRFMLETIEELNAWLGITISPIALTKYPTINKMTLYLVSLADKKVPPQDASIGLKAMIAKDVIVSLKCRNQSRAKDASVVTTSDDVIITGANAIENGFFSLYIIKELLEHGTGIVYCMVQECANSNPISILENLFNKFEIDISIYKNRIKPIQACYYKPKFGLDDFVYQELSEKVGIVLHNAANFNNLYEYNMLRDENVLCIDEILNFANCGRHKNIHYISSIVVNLVLNDGSETLCNTVPDRLTTGYFISRIAAEIKIKNAIDNGFSINVYRHPKLLNTIYDNKCASDDEFLTFTKFCLHSQAFPDLGPYAHVLLLRVTNAAKALINLIFKSETSGVVYNISNIDSLKYNVLFEWLKKFDSSLKKVTLEDFKSNYLSKSNSSDDYHVFKQHFEKSNYWGMLESDATSKQVNITIDNTVKVIGDSCYQLLNFTEADLNAVLNGLRTWFSKNDR